MKIPRGLRLYVVATQYVLLAAALTYLGYFGGHKLDLHLGNDNFFSFVFGLIGILVGLGLLILNLARFKHGKES